MQAGLKPIKLLGIGVLGYVNLREPLRRLQSKGLIDLFASVEHELDPEVWPSSTQILPYLECMRGEYDL
jgi:hypothetical protein